MNILLSAQCNKRALKETRRVLDQFAERKGHRTWQTAITQQGLQTLTQMLRRTARRNTAVACHWLKKSGQSELLFIIGDRRRFNQSGTVPTNISSLDVLRHRDENQWHQLTSMALLAAISGLFHDFGKANRLFQAKLKPRSKARQEPLRHEWLSLRLFQAFVGERSDEQWLQALCHIDASSEAAVLAALVQDRPDKACTNPFSEASLKGKPLAEAVAWLIVSHHRLPVACGDMAPIERIDTWRNSRFGFNAYWNSIQAKTGDWTAADWEKLWQFDHGTPMSSQTWRNKAQNLATRALKHRALWQEGTPWMQQGFSLHLARLSLMLSDHYYSSMPVEYSKGVNATAKKWQDKAYKAYANTDRDSGGLKQKLDEHNIGVAHNAYLVAKSLPDLRRQLPSIADVRPLKKRSANSAFRWQDKAYDLARQLRDKSRENGFFGVNMASTGKGKTIANLRIMYGLSDAHAGCRVSVALGLRSLTLQTGDALKKHMHIADSDMAVLIGSQAVKALHQLNQQEDLIDCLSPSSGSESDQALLHEQAYLVYDGQVEDTRLKHWLKHSRGGDKLRQLISAPVLVSTIDHLMPATESARGGRQIGPMLRLLTSDLILDEPDEFGLSDLPALCRLVNWAGLLGSRVLLSSATLDPAMVKALFEAYQSGRKHYQMAVGEQGPIRPIECAWFDEFSCSSVSSNSADDFKASHRDFVQQRVRQLLKETVLHKGAILPFVLTTKKRADFIPEIAITLVNAAITLHQHHGQEQDGKRISMGVMRMANITPLTAVAQALFMAALPEDYCVHLCIYHSQHPMIVRSHIEAALERILDRHDEAALWQHAEIQAALLENKAKHHLFITLASPVIETGRDVSFDWAITEPSSMRALIQLAGRVLRHHQRVVDQPNILIWDRNTNAMSEAEVAYQRPGFESSQFPLLAHAIDDILKPEHYQAITALPRIQINKDPQPQHNLVDLEHAHIAEKLFGESARLPEYAARWWANDAQWHYELQRRMPFRQSASQDVFVLYAEDEEDALRFFVFDEEGRLREKHDEIFQNLPKIETADRVRPWLMSDAKGLLCDLASQKNMEFSDCCRRFAEIRLRKSPDNKMPSQLLWTYHPWLGIFRALN